mgnify:CR=1 FL=1
MSNPLRASRKVELSKNQPRLWMEQVLDSGVGSFKIQNNGGDYIELHDGFFSMKFRGVTKLIKKPKEVVKDIFITRLERYQNFTYGGFFYYWYDGYWHKTKPDL